VNSLTLRERRLVAIAILLGLVALVYLAVLLPIANGFSDRAERREAAIARYVRNERAIAGIAALRRAADAQRADRGLHAFAAPSVAAAIERLKEQLGAHVVAAGGELKTVQEVAAAPGQVRAWAEGRLTMPQLVALLDRVRRNQPSLVVESLTVAADRAFQTGQLEPMDVRLEASARHTASAT
jgi:hypothetical protein